MTDRDFTAFAKAEIEQSIGQRFAACARRHGERVALQFEGRSVTYRELDERSNRIANAVLEVRGAGEETVALLLGQGGAAVVAILGLMKAGKAYVPIDPWTEPALRARLLEASGAKAVVTDAAGCAALRADGPEGILPLDVDTLPRDAPSCQSDVAVSPDRLAYVFFTSGTTGEPKGVADCHRNVLHNVLRYTNSLRIGPEDRLSLIQSWSFSGTVSSLFSALLNGATLGLYDLRRDGLRSLASWARRERVSIFHSVPHIFEQLVAPAESLPDLRIIRLEGDKATARHIDLFKAHFGEGCRLVNGLGTTETGLVCQYVVSRGTEIRDGVVPVGFPTADMEIRVIDGEGNALADGEPGEIVVRSRYLAMGYWQRPDLTRARFLSDAEEGSLRTYRTGDVGRLREDGCLEYLGRAGTDVRIRGQQIEIDSIEAALVEVPGIRKALVTSHESAAGHQSLVAYLVPEERPLMAVDRLRRLLAERLTGHAVPARFVPLDDLPVTPSGKIDRSALSPPADRRPDLAAPLILPRDVVEVQLKDIWEEILEVRPVGVRDDFFDLGGDSLLATEMLFRIETLFGTALTLDRLWLESTTIEEIAALLHGQSSSGFWRRPVPLQPQGDKAPIFCVHLEGGHLWPYRPLARCGGWDRPILGLPARGADGAQPADRSVEDMARHCVAMMREWQPDGPYHLAGFSSGGLIAFEVARQVLAMGAQIGALIVIDSPPPKGLVTTLEKALTTPPSAWQARLIQERLYQIALDLVGLSRLRRLKRTGESHRWALWRYRAGSFAGAMHLVRCRAEATAELDDWGWRRFVEGPVDVIPIEAPDHKALMQAPYVRRLADCLRGAVEHAESEAARPASSSEIRCREIA